MIPLKVWLSEPNPILIANPAAGSGRLRSEWKAVIEPNLKKILGPFTVHFTSGPGQAQTLARKAFASGAKLVVAMGGDGTLNEVLNGYFRKSRPINPQAEIGILPFGSGGDFIRSTPIEKDYLLAARRLVQGKAHALDVGLINFDNPQIAPRYFLNIANIGLVANIMNRVNRMNRKLPALGRYVAGSLQGFFDYTGARAKITLAPEKGHKLISYTVNLTNLTIANGRYFGRGMIPAPEALLNDGVFDIFLLKDFKTPDFLVMLPQLYLKKKNIRAHLFKTCHSHKITIQPVGKNSHFLVEADGETIGAGGVTVSLLPGGVRVRM